MKIDDIDTEPGLEPTENLEETKMLRKSDRPLQPRRYQSFTLMSIAKVRLNLNYANVLVTYLQSFL